MFELSSFIETQNFLVVSFHVTKELCKRQTFIARFFVTFVHHQPLPECACHGGINKFLLSDFYLTIILCIAIHPKCNYCRFLVDRTFVFQYLYEACKYAFINDSLNIMVAINDFRSILQCCSIRPVLWSNHTVLKQKKQSTVILKLGAASPCRNYGQNKMRKKFTDP